jgi:hypothetical protein
MGGSQGLSSFSFEWHHKRKRARRTECSRNRNPRSKKSCMILEPGRDDALFLMTTCYRDHIVFVGHHQETYCKETNKINYNNVWLNYNNYVLLQKGYIEFTGSKVDVVYVGVLFWERTLSKYSWLVFCFLPIPSFVSRIWHQVKWS